MQPRSYERRLLAVLERVVVRYLEEVYLDGDDRYKPFLQQTADLSKYQSNP